MAVFEREDFGSARWMQVKRGGFYESKTDTEHGGVSGVIDGIRIRENDRFGHLELHVRLVDPDVGAEGETVILAGTLTTPGNRFTIWSRMLVARLTNSENQLGPGEKIVIRSYPFDTDYGPTTCVALYRDGEDEQLPGVKIPADDRVTMAEGLDRLMGIYPWGRGATKPEIAGTLRAIAGQGHAERSELPEPKAETPDYEVVDTGPSEPPPPSDADGGGVDHDDLPF